MLDADQLPRHVMIEVATALLQPGEWSELCYHRFIVDPNEAGGYRLEFYRPAPPLACKLGEG